MFFFRGLIPHGRKNLIPLLLFVLSLLFFSFIFFLNRTFMGNFDEVDHIVAGYLMKSGRLLYTQNFSHHFPFPYYWVYLFTPLWSTSVPARTVAIFRLSLLVLYVICYILVFISYKNNKSKYSFSLWIGVLSLFFILYQGYVIVIDVFDAVFVSAITWLVLPIILKWEKPTHFTRFLVILFGSLAFWTFPLMGILLLVPFLLSDKKTILFSNCLLILLLNIIPLILFFFSGQLHDFLYQGLYFNFIVYPKYFLNTSSQFSSLINTIFSFFKNELLLFIKVTNPLQFLEFIFHFCFVWLLLKLIKSKNTRNVIVFFLIILVTRMKEVKVSVGVPFNAVIYSFVIVACACFVICFIEQIKSKNILRRIIGMGIFIAVLIAGMISLKPLFVQSLKSGYNYHVFWSYRQETGSLINKLSKRNESVLIYPHDVELYFFADRMPPDRFTYWFPWIDSVPQFREERLTALQKNPPAVIFMGNLRYNDEPDFYARLFPHLLKEYTSISVKGKKTTLWLRNDLKKRLVYVNE